MFNVVNQFLEVRHTYVNTRRSVRLLDPPPPPGQLDDGEVDALAASWSANRSKAQILEKRNPLVHKRRTSEMKMTVRIEMDDEEELVGEEEEATEENPCEDEAFIFTAVE
jgi:hypothetical protein